MMKELQVQLEKHKKYQTRGNSGKINISTIFRNSRGLMGSFD